MKDKKQTREKDNLARADSSKAQMVAVSKKTNRKVPKPLLIVLILLIIVVISATAIIYLNFSKSRIYIEKSQINAPEIVLSSMATGTLDRVFVKEGDMIKDNMIVAMVSGNPIKAKTDGLIISVNNVPGQIVNAQTAIVKMIDPNEFRVLGKISEDKGLSELKVGQQVMFTVDAFGSKKYYGSIERISPTSREADIVFSISDKREEKQFNVYVKYDINAYPELKNGMSAKMWVYK
jgi:multidrug resistance efflux pump